MPNPAQKRASNFWNPYKNLFKKFPVGGEWV